MNDAERSAMAIFASEMSAVSAATQAAWARLAQALGEDVAVGAQVVAPAFSPANVNMAWHERVLRQSLILHEIQQRGGSVPQTTWYEIAERYGYTGRGLAGFFRTNGGGLLELRDNKKVYITKRGRERLKQNQERVDAKLATLSEAAG